MGRSPVDMYARWITPGGEVWLVIGDATTEDEYAARAAAQLRLLAGEGIRCLGRYRGAGVLYLVMVLQ